MAKISLQGSEFEYIEKGSGETVIFVHGSINDSRIWKEQIEPFSKKYRVIAYSRRYHYPNTWTGDGSDYSIGLHVDDLISLIQSLGPGGVHLIGSSYGAYTSLLTAFKRPDLVKSLVLGEPPILPLLVENPENPLQIVSLLFRDFSNGIRFLGFALRHMKPAQAALKKDDLEEGVRLFGSGALGEGEYRKLPSEFRSTLMDNARSLKVELLGAPFPPFPYETARKMKIPTLLVYGKNSPRFLHAISDRLSAILPVCEKVMIPDASHLIHGQNPAEYNRKVMEFLDSIPNI